MCRKSITRITADNLRGMTDPKHAPSKPSTRFDWATSVVLPLVLALVGAALYDWIKQPGALAPVLVFAVLLGSLGYLGLSTAALVRRASRLRKISDLNGVNDTISADVYIEKIQGNRTKDHLVALNRESNAASISIVLFGVTAVAFIGLAPWLFGG